MLDLSIIAPSSVFCFYLSYHFSVGAWVAYHVKSRIRKSIAKSNLSDLPTASDCDYYVPRETLIRKGLDIVRTYPFYEELADLVQVKQDKHDVVKQGKHDAVVGEKFTETA